MQIYWVRYRHYKGAGLPSCYCEWILGDTLAMTINKKDKSMKTKSNYQDALKVIALVLMIIDYIGLYLMPEQVWMRMVGRFALPIFAFYAGYNFKGKIRHIIWIFGFVMLVAWRWSFGFIVPNILIDLAFGQLYLLYAGRAILSSERQFLMQFLGMLILTPFTKLVLDYGTISIAFMMVGFMVANKKQDKGHLLLATCSLMLFNLTVFDIDEVPLFMLMIFSVSISSFLLYRLSHKSSISMNLNIISRNMLYVYSVSTLSLMFMAVYL